MENKRYKPLIDKVFWIIWVPTIVLMTVVTIISFFDTVALLIMLATDIFTIYFILSPLFGYVELREKTVFVKLGFIMKKEIPYNTIRDVTKEHKLYADSMSALKNALDHVNIKYNKFDVLSVSVVDNDDFMKDLKRKLSK